MARRRPRGSGRLAGSNKRGMCPHLAVSHALMLAISSGSLEAEAGLHFQLPPTMGRRDIMRLVEDRDERIRVGVARSMVMADVPSTKLKQLDRGVNERTQIRSPILGRGTTRAQSLPRGESVSRQHSHGAADGSRL